MNIIIFDITNKFIKEAKRLEKYGITVIESSVEDLIKKHHIDAVVSPANSFGFMNGGIDKVYMKLFNGIESIVQNRIMQIGIHKNNYRSKYLPVGSAITVQTKNNLCPFLISAPTMTMPGNIKGTNNILLCFTAILYLAYKNPTMIIACPGLGTGVGGLSSKESIDQIEYVIKNHTSILYNISKHISLYDAMNIVLKN